MAGDNNNTENDPLDEYQANIANANTTIGEETTADAAAAAAGVERYVNHPVGGTLDVAANAVSGGLSVASPVLRAATRFSRTLTNAPLSYRFVVMVNYTPYGVFTECELPAISWETFSIKEGGQNDYVHQLLGRSTESSMTLKNGVGASLFISWFLLVMEGKFHIPTMGLRRNVTVTLLNPLKIPVMTWHIADAFPVEWIGPQLNTGENSVAIQTMKLACGGNIEVYPGIGLA